MLSTDDKKAIFLVALKELDGNVAKSCQVATIASRQTFYNWMETDETFAMAVRAIQLEVDDQVLDVAEEVLRFWLTKKLDKDVAKWILGKKGRARGYGNRLELEAVGNAFKDLVFPDDPATLSEWSEKSKPPQG